MRATDAPDGAGRGTTMSEEPQAGVAGSNADHDLLAALGELFDEVDPVPPDVLAAALGSFAWRDVDAELAELIEDSELAAAAVRGVGESRLLTFEAATVTVVVEVTELDGGRRLLGQVVPPGVCRLEVRHGTGSTTVETDQLGRFCIDTVPAGPVSILCAGEGREPVVTSWVSI
jgi:hypothetical protein